MILLERGNRILGETVSSKININTADPEEKVEPIDVRLCDFDNVSYRVVIENENRNVMLVAMNLPCYSSIENHGAKEAFTRVYGELATTPLANYDLTIKIQLDTLKEQKQKDEMVNRISCFKANIVAGVFDYFFYCFIKGYCSK